MKIRNGFVSNSSSSSFVCIVRKDAADKIRGDMTELQLAMFDFVFKKPKDILGVSSYEVNGPMGDNYYVYSEFTCPEHLSEEFSEKYQDRNYDLWDSVISMICRLPKDCQYQCYPNAG